MCIFTDAVEHVGATCLFARRQKELQYLVYAMTYAARQEVAMVLPLPVAKGAGEQAVVFISLEGYPEFFEDLEQAFPPEPAASEAMAGITALSLERLEVHEVGDYEASYVPGIGDFDRLDPRFRLPDTLWRHLPRYRDWGFAVFQLRPTIAERVQAPDGPEWMTMEMDVRHKVHPMALSFPSRYEQALFFPTVHIHNREWHDKARFDHSLYAQFDGACDWQASETALGATVSAERAVGLVDPDQRAYRLNVHGLQVNRDHWLAQPPSADEVAVA